MSDFPCANAYPGAAAAADGSARPECAIGTRALSCPGPGGVVTARGQSARSTDECTTDTQHRERGAGGARGPAGDCSRLEPQSDDPAPRRRPLPRPVPPPLPHDEKHNPRINRLPAPRRGGEVDDAIGATRPGEGCGGGGGCCGGGGICGGAHGAPRRRAVVAAREGGERGGRLEPGAVVGRRPEPSGGALVRRRRRGRQRRRRRRRRRGRNSRRDRDVAQHEPEDLARHGERREAGAAAAARHNLLVEDVRPGPEEEAGGRAEAAEEGERRRGCGVEEARDDEDGDVRGEARGQERRAGEGAAALGGDLRGGRTRAGVGGLEDRIGAQCGREAAGKARGGYQRGGRGWRARLWGATSSVQSTSPASLRGSQFPECPATASRRSWRRRARRARRDGGGAPDPPPPALPPAPPAPEVVEEEEAWRSSSSGRARAKPRSRALRTTPYGEKETRVERHVTCISASMARFVNVTVMQSRDAVLCGAMWQQSARQGQGAT